MNERPESLAAMFRLLAKHLDLTDIIVSKYARDNDLPNPITGDDAQRDLRTLAKILDEDTDIDRFLHNELTSRDSV